MAFKDGEAFAGSATTTAGWRLEHSYMELPALFFTDVAPTPVRAPRLVILNRALAEALGLEVAALESEEVAAIFAGNRLPPGARAIAQAYAGHQFGHFTPLGDGRAILLGEQITPRGERYDVQLKGAGPTPYSRRGDGRAALGPMLREYVISEAMHALGIPTTRSLAVAATGEEVYRQMTLPGAVLTRVAASHLRVGTFQWAAAHGDLEALRALVMYAARRHYPELLDGRGGTPLLTHEEIAELVKRLLAAVSERQAALIARWMLVGFVHGVMNTDNMAISGETIDYGPCAFMEAYDPATVFSSIDAHGRYAYGNQPRIAQWNLARFAETLLPLWGTDEARAIAEATEAVQGFTETFRRQWLAGMRRKLGLFTEEAEDGALVEALLGWMQTAKADFTNTFAELSLERGRDEAKRAEGEPRREDAEFRAWHERWRARLARQPQSAAEVEALRRASNPAFIPRNHRVEEALAAAERGDLGVLRRLLEVLARPYAWECGREDERAEYREMAPDGGAGYRTFCGT